MNVRDEERKIVLRAEVISGFDVRRQREAPEGPELGDVPAEGLEAIDLLGVRVRPPRERDLARPAVGVDGDVDRLAQVAARDDDPGRAVVDRLPPQPGPGRSAAGVQNTASET